VNVTLQLTVRLAYRTRPRFTVQRYLSGGENQMRARRGRQIDIYGDNSARQADARALRLPGRPPALASLCWRP